MEAVDNLKGRIWHKLIPKNDLSFLKPAHQIISAKLLGGRTQVHVYSNELPGNGFEPVEPDLEDVYFSAMAGCLSQTSKQQKEEGLFL